MNPASELSESTEPLMNKSTRDLSHSPGHDGLEHAVQLGVLVGVVGDELIGLLVPRDVQEVLAVVGDGSRGGRIRRRAADLILMKSDAALQNVLYTVYNP